MSLNSHGMYVKINCRNTLSLQKIAVWSIVLYIVLAVVFETISSPIARLASLGLYACLGFCGLYIMLTKRFRVRLQIVFLILLGIVLSISCLYTPTRASLVNMYIYRYWTSTILMCLILNVVSTKDDVMSILKATAVAGAFLALHMYTQYGFENLALATERMDDEMGNQNMLGMYCAFSVCVSFFFFFTQKKNRWFYLLLIAACVPAIMFTGSRKAILIIAVAIVVFLISYSEKQGLWLRLLGAALVIYGLIWLIYSVPAFSVIKMRFEETFSTLNDGSQLNESDENRVEYIVIGLKRFLESPIIGKGFFYSCYEFGTYTHNNFVELLLNNGIVGFLLFYIPYIIVFIRALRIRKQSKLVWALVCLLLSALITCDVGVVTYYNRYTMLLFVLCFCLVDAKTDKQNANLPGVEEKLRV